MTIEQQRFGSLADGSEVSLFRLDGGSGVSAAITNFGGVITSLQTPDRSGIPGEIGLGYATLDKYLAKNAYYGALIGRVANRIGGGRFTLDGTSYQLWTNPTGCTLHGGQEGFNRKLWDADISGDTLTLRYDSPDGEEKFPGTLNALVAYTLTGTDLRLDYEATTSAPTIVNLTNHTFFNLNCCSGDILKHELRIAADTYTPVDGTLIPTGAIDPVSGTPFDFTTAKPIGRDIDLVPGGYDLNYIFSDPTSGIADWKAEAHDPDSGRTLAMATTEPCVQFYSGNFLDGSDVGQGGIAFARRYAFCLEAQKHPDAINHPNFPSIVLRPGETYRQTTIYRFGVR